MAQADFDGRNPTGKGGNIIVATDEDFIPSPRPPCPECGSRHIKSSGVQWFCSDCFRSYTKIKRVRKYSGLLHCPLCNGLAVKNGGNRAVCKDCGKSFKAELATKPNLEKRVV